uniref:Uncharacterized protein n=1 Tax=Tanacetum cinerariifolium TaxID=118510 RepID=A0A6L2LD07_TANCI|nr:hypothetical protein [Tanacetum cinerariifolium]
MYTSLGINPKPQPTYFAGYRAANARWSAAPLSTLYPFHTPEDSVYLSRSPSVAPSVPCSASAGPSHKRCRFPTTSRPIAAYAPAILPSVPADRFPPHKRIEETKEELRTLRSRVVSLERENSSLRASVREAKLCDDSTRVVLQISRTGLAEVQS